MSTPLNSFVTTRALILILLVALILFAAPAAAQNPIANAYYCRMRCDASFAICIGRMGESSLTKSDSGAPGITLHPGLRVSSTSSLTGGPVTKLGLISRQLPSRCKVSFPDRKAWLSSPSPSPLNPVF